MPLYFVPDDEAERSLTEKWALRALERVELLDNGCWKYTGLVQHGGYGFVGIWHPDGRKASRVVHRLMYQYLVNPIGDIELDHLCRYRLCCNPEHLEPVTHKQNMERGYWSMRTHCKYGHPFSGDNLIIAKKPKTGRTQRRCKQCAAQSSHKYYLKKQAVQS